MDTDEETREVLPVDLCAIRLSLLRAFEPQPGTLYEEASEMGYVWRSVQRAASAMGRDASQARRDHGVVTAIAG
jgi:hypothetical protein